MLTNLCKVGGLYFFLFRLLCISAEAPGQVQLRFHLSQQFLMPAGLLPADNQLLPLIERELLTASED